ncbi:MAG: SDR family oxidoreductase [Myxococcales bacterium]|nr:SDR family oxidoreductase [Myxococcales bacterium]MCB9755116.1 SDR family oxidoreductase [Myxococcales bacterium]
MHRSISPPARVLVTGGAGYLGCVLVPKLLERGYEVMVLDLLWFGREPLSEFIDHPRLDLREGDIRDQALVDQLLASFKPDAVIHLAAISNDPSSEIDHELTRSVNRVALEGVMRAAKAHGVARFLYASSASVYGIKETEDVTEDLSLEPITLYARYKAEGEDVLNSLIDEGFCGVSVRAATVCGVSPRLRLDLTINILTEHAVNRGEIRVFGGAQMRPNIHIEDLTDLYCELLTADGDAINGRAFNVSNRNASVGALAEMIREVVDPSVAIRVVPTDDLRSYHLSAEKIARELGYRPRRPLEDAVRELTAALKDDRFGDISRTVYRNVAHMNAHPELWRGSAATQAPEGDA